MDSVVITDPLLEGNFYTSSKKNSFYQVKVDEKYLGLLNTNGSLIKTRMISIRDIIGCRCARRRKRIGENCECHPKDKNRVLSFLENTLDGRDSSAYLHIYSYVLKKSKLGSDQKRVSFKITLRFRLFSSYEDNFKEAIKWRNVLKQLVEKTHWKSPLLKSPENCNGVDSVTGYKFLIMLNPKSGPGKAKEIFQNEIMPILTEADVQYELYVTRARNDARNFIKTSNILKWKRGIVTIGGDGVLFEVINGIMERSDWNYILKNIPLAIIPGGSGNGLAKSLSFCSREPYDHNPVLISTLNIIQGFPIPIDLVRIETQSEVAFSFLSFGWGLIADIDIESERLRIIGSPRFMIWSIARLIGLRTYTGRLSFLRVPPEKVKQVVSSDKYVEIQLQDNYLMEEDVDKSATNVDSNSNSSFGMDSISLDTGCIRRESNQVGRSDSFYSLSSHKSAYHSDNASSSYLSLPEATKKSRRTMYGPTSQLPALNKPIPKSWEVYQGEFVMVHASYQSHLAGDVYFAPDCKPNDGIIWLLVVKAGITRVNLLQFLLGMSTGTHLNKYPFVEMIPVLAFRLEPMCDGSHIVVDGEVIARSSVIQAEVCPSIFTMLNKEPLEEKPIGGSW